MFTASKLDEILGAALREDYASRPLSQNGQYRWDGGEWVDRSTYSYGTTCETGHRARSLVIVDEKTQKQRYQGGLECGGDSVYAADKKDDTCVQGKAEDGAEPKCTLEEDFKDASSTCCKAKSETCASGSEKLWTDSKFQQKRDCPTAATFGDTTETDPDGLLTYEYTLVPDARCAGDACTDADFFDFLKHEPGPCCTASQFGTCKTQEGKEGLSCPKTPDLNVRTSSQSSQFNAGGYKLKPYANCGGDKCTAADYFDFKSNTVGPCCEAATDST